MTAPSGTSSQSCGRTEPHPSHRWSLTARMWCPGATAPSGAGEHRPGRPAEQTIADAIASVLVVPPETLGPLAERVADALGLPWPSGAGEAGPVLGEEAQRTHDLKCWPPFFEAVDRGSKPFEVRHDDRGYRVGDVLHLREWDSESETYTGRECRRIVTYLLDLGAPMWGLRGLVVLGLATVADGLPMMTSAEARPDAALSVPCLWYQCEAEPGERCRVEYGPLSRQPHPVRIKTAALVAAAEERGAAAERERIAVACEAEARKWAQPWDFHPAESAIAYERAAAIAREQS